MALKHTQAWSIIARLTSEHIESWEEEKRLRSGRHSDLDIYAIYRLSGNVEQPHRHRVRNILRRVLDFRQLQQPKINLLLRLPWLSHPHYQRSTREVLRRLVLDHRNWALPFHLPSTKLAETPHPRVHTVMWNFSSFQDCYLLTSAGPSSCQCAAWLKRQPWLSHVQGHVAAGLDEFRFPGTSQHVHYTSALASYYVDLSVYEAQVHERLRKWCLRHGLPLDQFHAPLMQHMRSQFRKHRQHASTHQLLTKHQLNILHRHLGQDFVCHNEDHDNHHLMFFCPQLYFKGLHNTWLQSGTFAATPLKPDQAEALIVEAIPRHLQTRYKWAYRKKTTAIPVGKVFLKRKKQWKSGRTIIAYHKVVHRQLFKAVAILLGEIAASTWQCSWGVHPTPRIWQNVKQYFDNTDDTVTLAFHNDDLVGFFNSVPQDQVCAAVEQLLAEHRREHPGLIYSVETQAAVHYNRVFAGKQSYGRTPTTRVIYDILDIAKSSFQCMYVQVGTLILRQVHGTAIGSQLSPVLSHICVARHEVLWQRIYGQWFASHNIFLERYVDNRFVIFPSPASGHPAAPLEALLHADFYGAPIVLEQVGSSEFLGFVIDVGNRAIHCKTPTKIWQIRGPHTAGSLSTLLSGARSRSALATKYAHPARAVQMALDQLRSIYLSAGYQSADLQHLFHLPAIPTGKNVYVLIVVVFRCLAVWLLLVLFCSVFFQTGSGSVGLLRSVFLFGFRGSLDSWVHHGACLVVQDVGLLADIGKRSSCSDAW